MENEKNCKLKIVSDGSVVGTKIYVDDIWVRGVQFVSFITDMQGSRVRMETIFSEADIEGDFKWMGTEYLGKSSKDEYLKDYKPTITQVLDTYNV